MVMLAAPAVKAHVALRDGCWRRTNPLASLSRPRPEGADEDIRTGRRQDGCQEALVAWFALVVAGLLEVAWALTLPKTLGFTRPVPTVAFLLLLAGSMYGLSFATRTLPLGTAYAVWVGIGAVGTVLLGVVVYGDPATPIRLLFLGLVLAGIVGLKFSG